MSWWNPWAYKRELELTRTQKEKQRQVLDSVRKSNATLTAERNVAISEKNDRQRTLEETQDELKKQKRHNEHNRSDIIELQAKVKRLDTVADEATAARDEMEQQKITAEQEREEALESMRAAGRDAVKAEAERDKAQDEVKELVAQADRLKNASDAAISTRNEAQAVKNKLLKEIGGLKSDIEGLHQDKEALRKERNKALGARDAAQVQAATAKKDADLFKKAQEKAVIRADELKAERDKHRSQAATGEQVKQKLLKEIGALKEDVASMEKRELSMAQAKQIAETKAESTGARNKQLLEEKEALREERDDLQRQLDAAKEVKGNLANQVNASNDRVKVLKGEKDALQDTVDQRNEELRDARRKVVALKTQEDQRPTVYVEIYPSKQGRKATSCFRFVARDGTHKAASQTLAVSPPTGTPNKVAAVKRVEFLSRAKWTIIEREDKGDGYYDQ